MKWANLVRRWTMRTIHSTILGAAVLGSASVALAQPQDAAVSQPPKHYAKSQTFDLPVQMEQADRVMISEFRLYVKTPTSPWKLQETGPQHLTRFTCRVPQDGEYWYTLATVDRAGRMEPADVTLAPPSQRVVVDTVLPTIDVKTWTTPENDLALRCTVIDANTDHASLQAICRTDAGNVPLALVPNQPGTFRLKGGELLRFPVIVSVKDLAGNLVTKEINVRDMIGGTLPPLSPSPTLPTGVAQVGGHPDVRDLPQLPTRSDMPPRSDMITPVKVESPSKKVALPGPIDLPTPQIPTGVKGTAVVEAPSRLPAPGFQTPPASSASRQLINTTRARIEYRIDDVGLSGVGRVEIHMTTDKGQTWHRLGEDADKTSPAEVNLPGDGIYGIRIVVTNGNGFGGKAPVRGDAPHCTIEVDTTSPFVQMRSADVIASAGKVEIRWNATDNNLGAEPVSLFYRARPDGPWQVIARNVKNDGLYRWAFPREAGGRFFFKVEVTDLAGNMSHDVSRQPVVIDISEPRATVVGVSGGSQR